MPTTTHFHLLLLLLLLLLPFHCFPAAYAAKVPAIIVFGDSTVDTGNNNAIGTVLTSNFPPYGRDFDGGEPTGRFCNGRLAPDFISEAFGLRPIVPAYLDPAYTIKDLATGVCFASAGTGLDNATANVLKVIPLWKEVEYFKEYLRKLRRYLGRAKARQTAREAVYIVSIGSNDFLENYYSYITGRFKQFTIDQFQDFLVALAADFITDIYRLGARKISFTGLSILGCLPLERTANLPHGGACIDEYNKVARDFNVKLQAKIDELCARLPGLRLRFSPTYDKMMDILHNPQTYGLVNVEEGCCGTGRFEMGPQCNDLSPFTCKEANKYMFWDAFHPSEKVNHIMADQALRTSLAEFL